MLFPRLTGGRIVDEALLDILDTLDKGPACVRDIQDDTGRDRVAIYRWLGILEAEGMVRRTERTRPPEGERGRWRQMWEVVP